MIRMGLSNMFMNFLITCISIYHECSKLCQKQIAIILLSMKVRLIFQTNFSVLKSKKIQDVFFLE